MHINLYCIASTCTCTCIIIIIIIIINRMYACRAATCMSSCTEFARVTGNLVVLLLLLLPFQHWATGGCLATSDRSENETKQNTSQNPKVPRVALISAIKSAPVLLSKVFQVFERNCISDYTSGSHVLVDSFRDSRYGHV